MVCLRPSAVTNFEPGGVDFSQLTSARIDITGANVPGLDAQIDNFKRRPVNKRLKQYATGDDYFLDYEETVW